VEAMKEVQERLEDESDRSHNAIITPVRQQAIDILAYSPSDETMVEYSEYWLSEATSHGSAEPCRWWKRLLR
jgi:hypothetical protein